jgi:hypothetical protein
MSMDIDTALHALLRKADSGVAGLQLITKAARLSKRQVRQRTAAGGRAGTAVAAAVHLQAEVDAMSQTSSASAEAGLDRQHMLCASANAAESWDTCSTRVSNGSATVCTICIHIG